MFLYSICIIAIQVKNMRKDIIPVIIGAAQFTQRKDTIHPLDPLKLVAHASENAIASTGNDGIKPFIDSLFMTYISSWTYADPPGELCEIIDIQPNNIDYVKITGSAPQALVNKAVNMISNGNCKMALITGGDAYYSRYRRAKHNLELDWPKVSKKVINEARRKAYNNYLNELEIKYNFNNATNVYALIETALRNASTHDFRKHLQQIGERYERFSEIASKNPHAWSQKSYNTKDIITPSPENRKICHPFTKRMVANIFVDQSAALVITSEDVAEELGIDEDLWVYPLGGVDLNNIFSISQRPRLHDSPAIREASKLALEQAGLTLDDIDAFDLYSCFPCMVEIARKEIGIPEDDKRDLTLTGGLSFFGGPFSSYSLHSIVTAVDLIQSRPSMKIMVLANGGYNTSQSIGIYGKSRPTKSRYETNYANIQAKINAEALSYPINEAHGKMTIEAYTFIFDRQGKIERGIAIGHMEDGRRTLAHIDSKSIFIKDVEQQDLIGKTYKIEYDAKYKLNKMILSE
jgi:acetyl-CoA C-acetyltransferase